jgi:hypothetical protein
MATENAVATVEVRVINTLANVVDLKALSEEFEGVKLTLEKVKIPAGGGLAFEIAGDDPENPDVVKSISGVIAYFHNVRAYYSKEYDGSDVIPDCASLDCLTGRTRDGKELICSKCHYAKFGSGKNNSQACKEKRRLYIFKEGAVLPTILMVPTGSLKECDLYFSRLLAKNRRPSSVVTKFSLKKETNATGIVFSQVVFAVERSLTPEESAIVATAREQLKEYALASYEGVQEEDVPDLVEKDDEDIDPLFGAKRESVGTEVKGEQPVFDYK